ncbi:MAG TPA: NAD(P)/FAD-dependent oxidoreductase [Noviherbaspirillum sp.]|jgi:thioredoxin reductase (NADPH)|uniref:NAD(P)/FAD-dependent oxidoreductase n=1 Tax=Noviherbaspirillum sp. TaxID=1926288 RepID=UPI002F92184B
MAGAPLLDCIIIGGGAAGLSAAIYLARFRRRFMLLDGGASRLRSIPTSHNYPGFAKGVHGRDLLARLQAQALEYGAPMAQAVVDRLERRDDGSFLAWCGDQRWLARNVIVATGVNDVEPAFAEVRRALAEGHLRYCPICDGFEAIGKRVAVIGRGEDAVGEAIFVRHFAHSVTLFSGSGLSSLGAAARERLRSADVHAEPRPLERIGYDDAGAMVVHLQDGEAQRFDVVYSALGTIVNGGLAEALGTETTDNGEILVDAHQQSSIEGLYAAGDVVVGLNQIAVAMGHAAIAATAIHNRLRTQDQ